MDILINNCSAMQNLREAVSEYYVLYNFIIID